ncbi:hypothetical protein K2P47_01285 [Patescibacteria group bacterium]|nr:hypothetical protein [Patescibacteria group bacterium]
MVQIPNPFKLMDDLLLDYVFNPITWKIEYRYGKNAMDVRIVLKYIGIATLMLLCVLAQAHLLFILLLALWVLQSWVGDDAARASWKINNKTGKNIWRINGFSVRRINDLLMLYCVIMPSGDFVWDILGNAGWLLVLSIPGYLDATDALPPYYRELKTAPQT